MNHRKRRDLALGYVAIAVVAGLAAFSLVACAADGANGADFIFADGTRGCKQSVGPVNLWDLPGGVPSGAKVIAEIPHGTRLTILERASRFGIDYYLVERGGDRGWIPSIFIEVEEPFCQ